jgi:hypothetical protein
MQEASFKLDASALKRGWQEAAYVALYVSKEAGMVRNGVWSYGKVNDVFVWILVRRLFINSPH